MVETASLELAPGPVAMARAALNALHWDEETTSLTNLRSKWFRCRMFAYGAREMMIEDLVSAYQSRVEHSGPTTHVQKLRHYQRHATQSSTHAGDHDHPPDTRTQSATALGCKLKSGKRNCEVQFSCVYRRFRTTQTVAGDEATWVEGRARSVWTSTICGPI